MQRLNFNPITVNLQQINAALSRRVRRIVTDVEVSVWLRASGLVPVESPMGKEWLADDQARISLRQLSTELDQPATSPAFGSID